MAGNTARIAELLGEVRRARSADLVMFPELAMCGYPPEDLLFHKGLRRQVSEGLAQIAAHTTGEVAALVGYPEFVDSHIYNSVAFLAGGRQVANYRKCCLPNYSVFDEERYFTPGSGPTVVEFRGVKLGLGICEDVWQAEPSARATAAGRRHDGQIAMGLPRDGYVACRNSITSPSWTS